MEEKQHVNEMTPLAGNGLMAANAEQRKSPTIEQNPNLAGGTVGGSEAVQNDAHMYMDWFNGNGPYGTFGRDHSYAISSLAVVNPAAAGAVVGTMAAASIVHGILTSAYVRAKQTMRRLKKLQKGVYSDKGYNNGRLFYGFGLTNISNKGRNNYGIGIIPFKNNLKADLDNIQREITNNGLDSGSIKSINVKDAADKKYVIIDTILNNSYKSLYIPKDIVDDVQKSMDEYRKEAKSWYYRSKSSSETYEEIINGMTKNKSTTPLIVKKDALLKK